MGHALRSGNDAIHVVDGDGGCNCCEERNVSSR